MPANSPQQATSPRGSRKQVAKTSANEGTIHRAVNKPLLIVSLVVAVLLGGVGYFIRNYQKEQIAAYFTGRAEDLFKESDWRKASFYQQQYLQLRPDDYLARVRLVDIAQEMRDTQGDRVRLVNLLYETIGLADADNQAEINRFRALLADELLKLRDFKAAAREADELISNRPGEYEPGALRVAALAKYAQIPRRGLVADTDREERLLRVPKSKQENAGRPGLNALRTLELAIVANPADVILASITATVYREHPLIVSEEDGNPSEKADRLMAQLVEEANSADAYVSRYQYRRRFLLPGALDDLASALQVEPNHYDANLLLAHETVRQRSSDDWRAQGEKFYQAAIEAKRNDARGYLGLSRLHWIQGDFDRAIEVLRSAEKELPQPAFGTRFQLAEYLLGVEKYDDAQDAIKLLKSDLDLQLTQLPAESRENLANQLRFLEARIHEHDGDVVTALEKYKTILLTTEETISDSFTLLLRQKASKGVARINTGLGKWSQAAEALAVIADRLYSMSGIKPHNAVGEEAKELVENLKKVILEHRVARLQSAEAFLRAGRPVDATNQLTKLEKEGGLEEQKGVSAAASRALQARTAVIQLKAELARQLILPPPERRWREFEALLDASKSLVAADVQVLTAELSYLLASGAAAEQLQQRLQWGEERFPESKDYWLSRASIYLSLGEQQQVLDAIDRYYKLESNLGVKVETKVSFLAELDRYEEAYETLKRFINDEQISEPQRLKLLLLRARLLSLQSKLDEALLGLYEILESAPKSREALVLAMEIAIAKADWQLVEQLQQQIVEARVMAPADANFYRAVRLINTYQELSGSERTELDRLIDSIRGDRPSWRRGATLAAAHAEALQDEPAAIRNYELAISLGDRNIKTLERLALLLRKAKRFDDAQKAIDLMRTGASEMSQSAESLAISTALRRRRFDEARQLAEQGVKKNPQDTARRIWLYSVLTATGETQRAGEVLAQARKDFPEDFSVWDAYFTYLVREGRADEAREVLKAPPVALSKDQFAVRLATARGLELLGDAQTALTEYGRLVDLKPESTNVRLRYANLLYKTSPAKAQEQLEEILAHEPKHAVARRKLAAILASAGQAADWERIDELLSGTHASNDVADRRLRALLLLRRGRSIEQRASYCEQARRLMASVIEEAEDEPADTDRILLAGAYEQEALTKREASLFELARQQLSPLVDRSNPQQKHQGQYFLFLLRTIDTLNDDSDGESVRLAFINDAQNRLQSIKEALNSSQKEPKADQLDRKQQAILALKRQALVGFEVRLLKARGESGQAIELLNAYGQEHVSNVSDSAIRPRLALGLATYYTQLEAHELAIKWYEELAAVAPGAKALLARSLASGGQAFQAVEQLLGETDAITAKEATMLASVLASSGVSDEAALEKALQPIESALNVNDEDIDLLLSVSVLEVTRGNQDEAIRLLRKILVLSPDHSVALNNLATLLGERENDRGEALTIVGRAIETIGRDAALLDTQGTIQLWLGDTSDAIVSLEEAVSGIHVDSRYYFHLAAAYLRGGRRQDAQQALDEAYKRGISATVLTDADRQLMQELGQGLGDRRAVTATSVTSDATSL